MFLNLKEAKRVQFLEEQDKPDLVLAAAALAGTVESIPARVFLEGDLEETMKNANAYREREILAILGDCGQTMINRICTKLWEDKNFVPATNRTRGRFPNVVGELYSSPKSLKLKYQVEFTALLKAVNDCYQAEIGEDKLVRILKFTQKRHVTSHANLTAASNIMELRAMLETASKECDSTWPDRLEPYREDMAWVVAKYTAIIGDAERLGIKTFTEDGRFSG